MKKRDTESLVPNCFYHIFARTNNHERLFTCDENYRFFLRRYGHFILPIAETYTYALLENHVHFLIKIREEHALRILCETMNRERASLKDASQKEVLPIPLMPSTICSYQFQRLFTSYAKAFNKQQNRYGNLIQRPFKRKLISDESHLFHLMYYHHNNPRKHGYTTDFRTYKWSSYQAILKGGPTHIERAKVLELFGGLQNFIAYHEQYVDKRDWEF